MTTKCNASLDRHSKIPVGKGAANKKIGNKHNGTGGKGLAENRRTRPLVPTQEEYSKQQYLPWGHRRIWPLGCKGANLNMKRIQKTPQIQHSGFQFLLEKKKGGGCGLLLSPSLPSHHLSSTPRNQLSPTSILTQWHSQVPHTN